MMQFWPHPTLDFKMIRGVHRYYSQVVFLSPSLSLSLSLQLPLHPTWVIRPGTSYS